MAATDRSAQARAYIPGLDGLRALAILLVFQFHVVVVTVYLTPLDKRSPFDEFLFKLFGNGYIGVDLFFVISGFLITSILLDAKSSTSYLRSFYARRVLRIFPVYYAFVLYLVLLPSWRDMDGYFEKFESVPDHQWWFWLYMSNIPQSLPDTAVGGPGFPSTHLWSLAIEEQFYIVWPLVVLACSRRWLLRVCVAAVGGALVFRVVASLDIASSWASPLTPYFFTPARLDPLAIGALIACVDLDGVARVRTRRYAPFVCAGSLLVLCGLGIWHQGLPPDEPWVHRVGFSALALLFGSCIVLLVMAPRETALHKLMSGATLRSIGKYSYAMYLFHPIVLAELGNRVSEAGYFPRIAGGFAASLLVYDFIALSMTFGLAWISWQVLEGPILRLKRRFPYDRPAMANDGSGSAHAEAPG
jgi:peptidoglycan/LPS O-acetylase OafA/YrhL